MLLILTPEDPKEVTLRKDILVRDSRVLPYLSKGHWSYMSKMLFVPVDGLGSDGSYQPRVYGTDDHSRAACPPAASRRDMVSSCPRRKRLFCFWAAKCSRWRANVAFLSPVTATVTHSIMNLSDKPEAWIVTNYWEGRSSGWQNVKPQPSVAAKPLKTE